MKTPNRAPRPIKGEITAVMLEGYNENINHWEWYAVCFDCTPYEAVKQYYDEIHDQKITKRDVAMYGDKCIAEYAQAYYITL